jgi:hypothetical protein
MPSSPPPYKSDNKSQEVKEIDNFSEEQIQQQTQNRQQPRAIRYTLVDQESSEFSVNDLTRSSSFRPTMAPPQDEGKHSESFSDPTWEHTNLSAQQKGVKGGAARVVSTQSDTRNEGLSPIYISRHNTDDWKVGDAALDLSASQLQARLENLQAETQSEHTNDSSQVLPGDTTVETDDYAHNGRFINLRRGDHSQEGSFRKRMLSPSSLPAIDESVLLPEESMQASTPKQYPNLRETRTSSELTGSQEAQTSPHIPLTPHLSPSKPDEKDSKSSSGSPLKLFGAYDTFTNQKLLRRLSQFEEHFDDDGPMLPTSEQGTMNPSLNEAFVAESSPEKVLQQSRSQQHMRKKMNSFGQGDLDDFQFSEEISHDTSRTNSEDEDKENISLPSLDPGRQTRFEFKLDPSLALGEDIPTRQRAKSVDSPSTRLHTVSVQKMTRPNTASFEPSIVQGSSQRLEQPATPRKYDSNSEGKRLPKSPLKDPTPKRRRTLQESEIAEIANDEPEMDSLRETHQQIQLVIGRKRSDARDDDDQQAADPKVLAMRQVLGPQTLTPSHHSSQQLEHAPFQEEDLASTQRVALLQQQKIAQVQAELDSTDTRKLPAALGIGQPMQNDSRKGSVTTQDFLDEAKKIMAGIRGKTRPRSGLASLEESEFEIDRNAFAGDATQDDEFEDSYQESTQEPFSRPPSREGRPVQRPPMKQQDPQLLDHLRKYAEISDMDEVVASSIKSIAMAKEAANSAREIDRIADETISRSSGRLLNQGNVIESDPPNIRIIQNPEQQRKRKHSTSSVPPNGDDPHETEFPSYGSNASSNISSSPSIPTSRGSDSRRIIAPHTVSHLIPEQLAGMVFDRERNIWVKGKSVSGENGAQNFLPSDETDDEDPFGDIPDLSVDETQEFQRLKSVAAKRKEEEQMKHIHYDGSRQTPTSKAAKPERLDMSSPTNENSHLEDAPSSELTRLTRLATKATDPEAHTRLTSWGDEAAHISETNRTVHQRWESTTTEIREEFIENI